MKDAKDKPNTTRALTRWAKAQARYAAAQRNAGRRRYQRWVSAAEASALDALLAELRRGE